MSWKVMLWYALSHHCNGCFSCFSRSLWSSCQFSTPRRPCRGWQEGSLPTGWWWPNTAIQTLITAGTSGRGGMKRRGGGGREGGNCPFPNQPPDWFGRATFQVDLGVLIVWQMALVISSRPFEIYVKCPAVKTDIWNWRRRRMGRVYIWSITKGARFGWWGCSWVGGGVKDFWEMCVIIGRGWGQQFLYFVRQGCHFGWEGGATRYGLYLNGGSLF